MSHIGSLIPKNYHFSFHQDQYCGSKMEFKNWWEKFLYTAIQFRATWRSMKPLEIQDI